MKGNENMKKFMAAMLIFILVISSGLSVSAATKYSPNTVKKLGTQGKLPKTVGHVGMTYGQLKKQIPGHLEIGEAGTLYYAKNSTAVYLFLKYDMKQMKNSSKVYLISRTFKQSSFTKPLTASVMKKNFNGKTKVGSSNYFGGAVYKPAYKTNSKNYIMHNINATEGIVTLTVGTKKNLQSSGWWLNS
ncbi:MAG: hypothetical protein KBT36_11740 [Kurthia sp.]|nr:hypothetical protein [Candidatus Kurthia equi]